MHVFLELWNPKPSWKTLAAVDRQALIDRLGGLTEPIVKAGHVEILGWGSADPTVDHPEGHQYFAVWRAPTRDCLDRLRAAIFQGGWYEHFEQVNVTGELATPDVVIGELLST
ncbi:DUF6616 family protein [Duganella hordei]|uniref:DUF6616 family protein n=1 Tax=Duganella hordei TaxID=2865934 RepID=UPI0030EABA1F